MSIANLVNLKEREFEVVLDSQKKKFKLVKPNFIQGNKADLVYKAAFNEALRMGVPTAVQMKEFVDGQDFFVKSGESLKNIDVDIDKLCKELEKFSSESEATMTILKVKELRARRMVENFKINSIYENTAESYAEGVRNQFYSAELLRDSSNGKVFKSFDEFKEKASDNLAQETLINVMMFMARISDNFQMEYPENKWMLEKGIIDDKGNYIGKVEEPKVVELKTESSTGSISEVVVSDKAISGEDVAKLSDNDKSATSL